MSCRIDFAEPSGRSWAAKPHLQQQKPIVRTVVTLVTAFYRDQTLNRQIEGFWNIEK
jgi:hypothetical protein